LATEFFRDLEWATFSTATELKCTGQIVLAVNLNATKVKTFYRKRGFTSSMPRHLSNWAAKACQIFIKVPKEGSFAMIDADEAKYLDKPSSENAVFN
jgi:hypothetical protein